MSTPHDAPPATRDSAGPATSSNDAGVDELRALVATLRDNAQFDHPVTAPSVIETHISVLLLTGPFVYKFKKPVAPGFLDFTTLAARERTCRDEVRLNRRLAPDLYEGVVAVSGTHEHPMLGGDGLAFEYAVKMRQFPQSNLLRTAIADDRIERRHLRDFAATLAAFHAHCRADTAHPGERARIIRDQAAPCIDVLRSLPQANARTLNDLAAWLNTTIATQHDRIVERAAEGAVREVHGDLHTANVVLIDDRLVAFDCLEFDRALRTTDVLDEIAFLAMDLHFHARRDLAHELLNEYLATTGDYTGLPLWRLYCVYRALVRARVSAPATTGEAANDADATARAEAYLALAQSFARPPADAPLLLLMHGVSGSGKSTVATALGDALGAIVVRSDLERRRLHIEDAGERYGRAATDDTYAAVARGIAAALDAGFDVIADATFLDAARRKAFTDLARTAGARCAIIHTSAPEPVLRERLRLRETDAAAISEADIQVLERQLDGSHELGDEASAFAVTVDTSLPVDYAAVATRAREVAIAAR